jgi:vibriolysin
MWFEGSNASFKFGKGDRPLDAFDVVAHEFTHAVTDSSSRLMPERESGALDEAFADILAATGEALVDGAFSARTWTMADEIYRPAIPNDGVRYLNDPALDGKSRDFYPEREITKAPPGPENDFGAIYANAGIANLAYYLLLNGGVHPAGRPWSTFRSSTISRHCRRSTTRSRPSSR